jgi:DNA-directed RNA polymerase subunit beta'
MGDKLQIDMPGDTDFLVGEVVERCRFVDVNEDVMAAGGDPATARVLLLGITRSLCLLIPGYQPLLSNPLNMF